ncbi:MAG TPA: hypothetical protein DEE98_04470 [Elusimicrobia bacterium]|nr:MAG: hypothetical protein A2278_08785 [Elusimicrobia bacterium RIFOXYA12_FULL_49_49]OGS14777.1 MAG: hypothetical protein A2251_09810 [Elusimicrobia bacterium RIFOXYA2_FULL_47_53]OGS25573.1 MAG: hypothetical protein A2339_05785 [Elusimicrobia bacterium RIFOXYB12_FULL_50_12]OGS28939.1 MAG: hypothetical protein A2323_05215 [Elusimicrobia bacterium RIFOXYB2_FULL_46_23]HBU69621.1 hypothetical protein [Elusimicrobiota bacterium]
MHTDTHCHLLDSRFDSDRADALTRARAAGVSAIIEVACMPGQWEKAVEFCRANGFMRCVLGIHPQDAKLANEKNLADLKHLAAAPEVTGIGETGFDFYYENSPRETQKKVFISHINIAREINKPLVVHCRDAYKELIDTLKSSGANNCRGVIHCFSGDLNDALALLDMGFYLGIDGPVTYPKAAALKDIVRQISLDRIVVETDSPYLPPQKFRGQRNEPAYLEHIIREIASLRDIPFELAAAVVSRNASKLFGI